MADFDPDAYLANSPPASGSGGDFDPDAYIRDFNPDEYLGTKPEAEGPVTSNVRSAAHGIIPALGAVAGGALGGAAAGALGAGPVGAVVGGIAGGIAGGFGADVAQDKLQENIPAIDDRAQMQADREKYPVSTAVSGMAPFVGNPGKLAGSLVQRGANAAMLGGMDAAQQAYSKGDIDPAQVLAVGAFGAAFPQGNRATRAIHAKVENIAGRPGKTENNPDAQQAHEDVGDHSTETAVGDSALAESPPGDNPNPTVGAREDNKPLNSQGEVATGTPDGSYAKKQPASAEGGMTTGQMSPDIEAALTANEEQTPQAAPAPPQQRPLGMPPQNFKPPEARPAPPEPVVDAGFPKTGEPVAVGENEATPMPADMPQRTAAAIARSKSAQDAVQKSIGRNANKQGPVLGDGTRANPNKGVTAAVSEEPRFKGETPINESVTDAQAKAGNYPKAKANDFGKPMRVETHEGDIRRSRDPANPWENESPYEYGYFGKTKSTDGEGIDFAEPKVGSPDRGDAHFIIDQKNAETGKYDEPKVFQYYKDKQTAINAFNRGFSDEKGPDRMHDITEVSRTDLVKYLAKHSTKPPKGPFGEPLAKVAKPLREREGVKAAAEKLKAKGNVEGAEKLLTAPDEALAGRVEGLRARKYGVKGGYPVEGLTNEAGEPVTAKDKKLAAERSAAHKQVKDWFENSAPKANEKRGLAERLIGNPYIGRKVGVWVPSHMPREWLYAAAARDVLRKPTPKNIESFKQAEAQLRGSDEDVNAYRSSRRTDADIAMSRRGGDEAVNNAEAEAARSGRNDEEEKMLERIGKQRGDFDVPHEEAEEMVKPRPIKKASDIKEIKHKQIDVGESKLAEAPKVVKPIGKQSLKELMAKPEVKAAPKAEFTPADAKTGKSIKDKMTAEDMQKYVDLSNKAAGRKSLTDEEIARMDLGRDFLKDEGGALGGRNNAARGKWLSGKLAKLFETTPVKSYRALPIETPTNKFANKLFEDLHVNDNMNTLHKLENVRRGDVMERDADRMALERIYKAREADSAHVSLPGKQAGKSNVESLSPADTKVWNEHIDPLLKESDEFKDAIRLMDPKRMGPDIDNYIARLTKGNTSEYNMLRRGDDPTGPHGMAINAGMAKERAFTVLERNSDGKRFVVYNHDDGNGFTHWENQKGIRIKDPSYEFEQNQPYTVKNNKTGATVDYTMRHATADEIERSGAKFEDGTPAKYHQNAGLSALLAHAKLGEMARNLAQLAKIKSTKDFQDRSTRNAGEADRKGYVKTTHPNFEGEYMDPRLAKLLDQYAKPGFNTPEWLRSLNQGVTKLLFWMPTAHIANVGTHWAVGRGLDWASIPGYYRLAKTTTKAIKAVLNGDSITTQRLMSQGASMIYPSVQTRNFIEQIAKSTGEEMVRNPSKWGPVADAFKVPLEKLSKAVYDNSSKVMWAANDVFMHQRMLELEMKGMSTEQAIKQAERDIPNYRVPPQLFTGAKSGRGAELGTFVSKVFQDPAISSFGRYHVGMWTSYANIFKDGFSKNSSVGDRVDAAGKLMVLGALAFAVYPALDKMSKLVTGNEDASQQRRGPVSIPAHLAAAAQGKEDIATAGRSTLTIPPFWSTVLEALNNKDFRGKSIVEPGDMAAGFKGDAYRGGKAAVQLGEHFARGMISPLGTLSSAEKKNDEPGALGVAKAVGGAVRDQALDEKNPGRNARRYLHKQDIINERNARSREKHGGSGVLEEGYIKAHKWLTQ